MIELIGDVWNLEKDFDGICITTNGMIKKNGECVMGKGIAGQFKNRFPFAPKILGDKIIKNGNIFQPIIWNPTICYFAFPTKHHWYENSDIELIKKSADSLNKVAIENPNKKYLLPRPGCSNGNLKWEDVKPIINFLPNNVYIVSNIDK